MKVDLHFLDCVGDISALVGEGPGSLYENIIVWYYKNYEIHLNWEEKRICLGEVASKKEVVTQQEQISKKEYFTFMGVAEFYKLAFDEGYIDYNCNCDDEGEDDATH